MSEKSKLPLARSRAGTQRTRGSNSGRVGFLFGPANEQHQAISAHGRSRRPRRARDKWRREGHGIKPIFMRDPSGRRLPERVLRSAPLAASASCDGLLVRGVPSTSSRLGCEILRAPPRGIRNTVRRSIPPGLNIHVPRPPPLIPLPCNVFLIF